MPARTKAFGSGGPLVYLLALVTVIITLGPVVYGALGGFRSNEQLARDPSGLPDPWVWTNYSDVMTNADFWRYALNSTVIALITTVVAVLFGVMAAYPLARYQFTMREPLFMVFVLGLLFPAAVAIIPLFILVTRDLQLDNTFWGVALPQAAFALPMTVVILRPFLMAIPRELEEAARRGRLASRTSPRLRRYRTRQFPRKCRHHGSNKEHYAGLLPDLRSLQFAGPASASNSIAEDGAHGRDLTCRP